MTLKKVLYTVFKKERKGEMLNLAGYNFLCDAAYPLFNLHASTHRVIILLIIKTEQMTVSLFFTVCIKCQSFIPLSVPLWLNRSSYYEG